ALNGHELGGIHETFVHWFYPGQHNLTPGLLILFMICVFVAQLFTRPIDGALYSMTATLGGSLYTTLTTAHALLLFAYPKGVFYLTFFVVMPIAMDSGAYFAGRWFGRHNAGLKVSPKKTYEGYVGGIIFTVLVGIGWLYGWKNYGLESYRTLQMSYVEAGVYAFLLSILSIFGDLAESAFKRDAKTKDSASTIPGHGGMLDLADAIYLCIPIGYYIMLFRQMLGLSF
ncbi:MAG: phosphatidate cytidylyltransferase, partial [Leptospiraceae bacterium]|nr:phosphatidate cytidylyltransferase [Leptospiraceae bacterium]